MMLGTLVLQGRHNSLVHVGGLGTLRILERFSRWVKMEQCVQ